MIVRYAGSSVGNVGGTVASGSGSAAGTTLHTFTSSGSFNLSGVDMTARLKSTLAGNIIGTGGLVYSGPGQLALAGTNTYTGPTTVTTGTLAINSSITTSSSVTVQSGATVSGLGGLPTTTVSGSHSPGSGPGIQPVTGDLSYATGSTLRWELAANDATAANRSVNYDGIDVSGQLSIAAGVTSQLVFNGAGSTVDFTNAFWQTSRSWLVFDNASAPTLSSATNIFDTVTPTTDAGGRTLTAQTGLANARFYWTRNGDDVVLNYSPGASLTTSTVAVSRSTMGANGDATATVTIQPRNAAGNATNDPGLTFSFAALGANQGSLTTPVYNSATGTYTATYTAGTALGVVTITPRVHGGSFTNTATVTLQAVGPASTATSTVSAAVSSLTADGSSTTTLTVVLRDANGDRLIASGGTVTFTSLTTGQGSIGTVTNNNNGTYTAAYTAGTTAGPVTVTPRLGGTAFTNTATITLTAGAATTATSTAAPARTR